MATTENTNKESRTYAKNYTLVVDGVYSEEIFGTNKKVYNGNSYTETTGDSTNTITGNLTRDQDGNTDENYTGNIKTIHKNGLVDKKFMSAVHRLFYGVTTTLKGGGGLSVFAGLRVRVMLGADFLLNTLIARFILSEDSLIIRRNRFIVVNAENAINKDTASLFGNTIAAQIEEIAASNESIVVANKRIGVLKKAIATLNEREVVMQKESSTIKDSKYNIKCNAALDTTIKGNISLNFGTTNIVT